MGCNLIICFTVYFPCCIFILKIYIFFFNSGPFKHTDLVTKILHFYIIVTVEYLVKTSGHQVFAV